MLINLVIEIPKLNALYRSINAAAAYHFLSLYSAFVFVRYTAKSIVQRFSKEESDSESESVLNVGIQRINFY